MKKLLSKKKEKQILKALSYNVFPSQIAPRIGFTKRFVYMWMEQHPEDVKIAKNKYEAFVDGLFDNI